VPPSALKKVKKVPRHLLNIYNNNNLKREKPHPFPLAKVKNGNKSLTHNKRNKKRKKNKTHAILPP
jgi:hypothetical protein